MQLRNSNTTAMTSASLRAPETGIRIGDAAMNAVRKGLIWGPTDLEVAWWVLAGWAELHVSMPKGKKGGKGKGKKMGRKEEKDLGRE